MKEVFIFSLQQFIVSQICIAGGDKASRIVGVTLYFLAIWILSVFCGKTEEIVW